MAKKVLVSDTLRWLDADAGYALALDGLELVCRNPKGSRLASLPPKVKDHELAEELRNLVDWLKDHEARCRQSLETWMLRSLPFPRLVIEKVWPDPAWRRLLSNVVLVPVTAGGDWQLEQAGFLRELDPQKGLGLVGSDGESRWILSPQVALPHPILVPELQDLRELATELDLTQVLPQLFRETWHKPPSATAGLASSEVYGGGRFLQLAHAVGRARSFGFPVRGGWACCRVFEGGRRVEARYYLGEEPMEETFTGELMWVDQQERALPWSELGPVAYSEGHRMASLIFAGRELSKDAPDSGPGTLSSSAGEKAPSSPSSSAVPVRMSPDEALLAGGLITLDTELPAEPPRDVLVARTYRHRALEEAVVRLIPDLLVPGEDRVMDFLGFGPGETSERVAFSRRRPVGFPGWALLHDPERAAFALEVVKEFKKFATRAKVKALIAKEGFDAIGERLGRSVPHFLPSFYEEAGRVFLEAGNIAYAGQAFGKAREAERVHSLVVDEERRLEAFVEFALAGAVTVKALGAYAQELAKSCPPQKAYESYRQLCIRRVLGGLPPFSGMAKELRGLAKAAGLDVAAEEAAWLRILLPSPVLGRAPKDFWTQIQRSLVALCREDAALRGRLLNLFPGAGLGSDFHGIWLDLLRECGALAALSAPAGTVPAEAEMIGGPAAFFHRFVVVCGGTYWAREPYPPQLFALLREAAPRLKNDGIELDLTYFQQSTSSWIQMDLLDFALELQLPLSPPRAGTQLNLAEWLAERVPREGRRDPVFIAADPRFSPLLVQEVGLLQAHLLRAAQGKKGLISARRAYFEEELKTLVEGSQLAASKVVARLTEVWSSRVLEDFPELAVYLDRFDPAAVLARTLRVGVLDEFGWPELEAAVDELGGASYLGGVFPHWVVAHRQRAIVLGPGGRLAEFDLHLPADSELESLLYCGGQLLVGFSTSGRRRAYWSNAPTEIFDFLSSVNYMDMDLIGVELESGGLCLGDRAVHPGDRSIEKAYLYSDGRHLWRRNWAESGYGLREIDPDSGQVGRDSLPQFFEEFAGSGYHLDLQNTYLYPLPKGLENSPLGCRDGLAGWRVRLGSRLEAEGIDGRRWVQPSESSWVPLALVLFAGDDRPRLLVEAEHEPGMLEQALALWDAAGRFPVAEGTLCRKTEYGAGSPFFLPLPCWHFLSPRDPAGSAALRRIGDEVAAKLLAAARLDRSAKSVSMPATMACLGEAIPEIQDSRLRQGVAGLAGLTCELAERAAQLLFVLASPEGRAELGIEDEEELSTVVDRLLEMSPCKEVFFEGDGFSQQMEQTQRFFAEVEGGAREPRKVEVSLAAAPWEVLLGLPGTLAFLAASRSVPENQRQICRRLLAFFSLLPSGDGRLRFWTGRPAKGAPFEESEQFLAVDGSNAYLVKLESMDDFLSVLEFAPDGEFHLPKGMELEAEVCISWPVSELALFEQKLAATGIPSWDRNLGEEIGRRTGLTPAAAALLWLGCPNFALSQKDFLPKNLREELGLSVAEAAGAREELRAALGSPWRLPPWTAELYAAAFAVGPEALWQPLGQGPEDEKSAVAALANALIRRIGRRVPIPAELVLRAQRELVDLEAAEALAVAAQPSRLGNVAPLQFETYRFGPEVVEPEGCFTRESLKAAAQLVPFLYTALPVGNSLRANLPKVLELTLASLDNPDLLLELTGYVFRDATRFVQNFGAPAFAPLAADPDVLACCDTGDLVLMVTEHPQGDAQILTVWARPAGTRIQNLRAVDLLAPVAEAYPPDSVDLKALQEIHLLRSEGFRAMAERVNETPVPVGSFEANPRFSAPDCVARLIARFRLGEDAAVLYLQTLALAEPTAKAVQEWNGWKAPRYKKAADELTRAGLLLEAKRERAGRAHFLPGGWLVLKAPDLPIETWKLPLYGVTLTGKELKKPLPRIVPLRPLHEIFAAALERLEQGDVPAYEKVD